jgi:uncharacterized membrane protein
MNAAALRHVVALGAITGMRSMAGAATLALTRDGGVMRGAPVAIATAEMLLDKTALVGARIAPIPLAGRAVMGAFVGSVAARDAGNSAVLGALLGSVTAMAATYIAYHARTRLPVPNVLAGALEDVIVIGLTARYGRQASVPQRGQ